MRISPGSLNRGPGGVSYVVPGALLVLNFRPEKLISSHSARASASASAKNQVQSGSNGQPRSIAFNGPLPCTYTVVSCMKLARCSSDGRWTRRSDAEWTWQLAPVEIGDAGRGEGRRGGREEGRREV